MRDGAFWRFGGRQVSGMTKRMKIITLSTIMAVIIGGLAFDLGKREGYALRDHEISQQPFHVRKTIHWLVTEEYPSASYPGHTAFTVDQYGDKTRDLTPCEERGLHPGAVVVSAGFRDMGKCLSFAEPGWMNIEWPRHDARK